MAADQERADRIRELKQQRPDLTWRRIGDYVGVSERAATDWQKKGGIEYDNAKKLAELFEVEVDYIWRGPKEEDRAPSPFAGQDALADRLDAIEQAIEALREERASGIDTIRKLLRGQDARLRAQDERLEAQDALLNTQTGLIAEMNETLKSINASVTAERAAKADTQEATRALLSAVDVANRALLAGSQETVEAPAQPAT